MTHVLLKSYHLTDSEWKQIAEKHGYDLADSDFRQNVEYFLYANDLEYTRILLKQLDIEEDILVLADISLGGGRILGCKSLSNKAEDIVHRISYDDKFELFLNDKNELEGREPCRGGTNYYSFKIWRPGFSRMAKNYFLCLIREGEATEKDIQKYTKALKIPAKIL